MDKRIDNKKEKLHNLLFELFKYCEKRVLELKENQGLVEIPYEYIPVHQILYQPGSSTYSLKYDEITYFTFYDWSTEKFIEFTRNEIPNTQIFNECVDEIVNLYNHPRENVESLTLQSFLRVILHKIPNKEIDDKSIHDYIVSLVKDLDRFEDNNPLYWNVMVGFRGLFLQGEEFIIGEDLTLRRPLHQDLDSTRPKTEHISEWDKMTSNVLETGSIAEFQFTTHQKNPYHTLPNEVLQKIQNTTDIFLLFKLSDLSLTFNSFMPFSIFNHGYSQRVDTPFDSVSEAGVPVQERSDYLYEMKESDIKPFERFNNRMQKILVQFKGTSYLDGNPHELAFHRYKDAVLQSKANVRRILNSMSTLEAIFGDTDGEISFKIRTRASCILQFLGINSIQAYKDLRDAYAIRSKLIHGSKLDKKLREFSQNRTHYVVEYTRVCLIVFLQLKDILSKESFINLINNSFIDQNSMNDLKILINDNTEVPLTEFRN